MSRESWSFRNKYCQFSLNLPRSEMPQVPTPYSGYLAWLELQGLRVVKKQLRASQIKPSQREISRGKVESILEAKEKVAPLFISSDYHLLDGHHRWAAYIEDNPNQTVPVIQIQLNIGDLIPLSFEFKGVDSDPKSIVARLRWDLYL